MLVGYRELLSRRDLMESSGSAAEVVSSSECGDIEIVVAREDGRMCVDDRGYGWIARYVFQRPVEG